MRINLLRDCKHTKIKTIYMTRSCANVCVCEFLLFNWEIKVDSIVNDLTEITMREMRLREGNGRDEGDGVIEKARGSAERRWRGEKDEKWALRDEMKIHVMTFKRRWRGKIRETNRGQIIMKNPSGARKGWEYAEDEDLKWKWWLMRIDKIVTKSDDDFNAGTRNMHSNGRCRWSVFSRGGSSNGFSVDNDGDVSVSNHRDFLA